MEHALEVGTTMIAKWQGMFLENFPPKLGFLMDLIQWCMMIG